jgi:hypothetical protein
MAGSAMSSYQNMCEERQKLWTKTLDFPDFETCPKTSAARRRRKCEQVRRWLSLSRDDLSRVWQKSMVGVGLGFLLLMLRVCASLLAPTCFARGLRAMHTSTSTSIQGLTGAGTFPPGISDVPDDNNGDVEPGRASDRSLRKAAKKGVKEARRALRAGEGPLGNKACDICSHEVGMLIRCRTDESRQWRMVCGGCWKGVSGGVTDGDAAHPFYTYGGVWKNK